MKKLLSVLLTIVMGVCLVSLNNNIIKADDPEFYAVYDTTDGANKLSFYYDSNKGTRTGTLYDDLPTEAVSSDDWEYDSIREDIKDVIIDSSVKDYKGLKSTAFMFSSMEKATNISGCEYLDTSNVTDMSYMFESYGIDYSSNITVVPNVLDWDTSNVTNMSCMFYDYAFCSGNITAVPDVSKWDTSKVTDMSYMFFDYAHNSDNITAVPDVSKWNTSSVINIDSMFYQYGFLTDKTLKPLDISGWSISSLTYASSLFYQYNYSASGTPIIYGSDWSTTKSTGVSASDIFYDTKLKGNTSGEWSSANTSTTGCFTAPPEFYAVYDTTDGANKLSFYYDSNKGTRTGTLYDNLTTEATYQNDWKYDGIRSSVKDVIIDSSVKNYKGLKSTACMFYGMEKATNISGCEYLDTSNVTNMGQMFCYFGYNAADIVGVPNVSSWNTGNVKTMSMMFYYYAGSSTTFSIVPNVLSWNTGNVTDMSYMFKSYAGKSKSISSVPDVSSWNTSKVSIMLGMFSSYANDSTQTLKPLDISGWSISSLTSTRDMFNNYNYNAGGTPIIYGSDWSTIKTTGVASSDMFGGSKLKGTKTGDWASANTSTTGCFTAKQTLSFKNSTITKTYGDANFTQAVTGAKTTVTYESDDTNVAEVNSSTGEVTIKGAGEAIITATAVAGDVEGKSYGSATETYTLTVNKAKVDVPKAKTGLVYTGSEQTGVEAPANAKYTLSSNKATSAYNYTAKAVLTNKTNYEWNLTTPTSADQDIAWKIIPNVDASKSNVSVNGNKLSTSANKGKFSDLVIDINDVYVDGFVAASLKDKDGNVIPDVITVSEGSIKVTISADYVNTLSPGTHNFTLHIVNPTFFQYDYSLSIKVNGDTTSSVTKDESCEKVIGPTWHWNNTKGVCEEYALVRTVTR